MSQELDPDEPPALSGSTSLPGEAAGIEIIGRGAERGEDSDDGGDSDGDGGEPDFLRDFRSERRDFFSRANDEFMDEEDQPVLKSRSRVAGAACAACLVVVLAVLVSLGMLYAIPQPLSCVAQQAHAGRFKIDVSDLWTPRLSSTLQLVLSVRNSNLFGSMLLEECKVVVYDEATGFKLGTATHGALYIEPMRSLQVNLAVKQAGGSLPPPEQRRLVEAFLRHKALLLTIVATATSKIPSKGAKSSQVTSNSTKRLDLGAMFKDPFYTRPPPPPKEEKEEPTVHDVPI